MKSTELRIGNLVSFGGRLATVYQVNRSGAVLQYEGDTNTEIEGVRRSTVSINDIEPVRITEEILIKSGFYKDEGSIRFYIKHVMNSSICAFRVLLSNTGLYFPNTSNVEWVNMTGVHQLQNLYFAITGQELSV